MATADVCMSDEVCIDDVPNFINNDKSSKIMVYVGIGSALPYEKISDNNHHQYPPCLQRIKNKHVGAKLYFVLIDPDMELVPYVAKEYKMEKFENYENVWTNKESGMTVISIKKAVTYHLALDNGYKSYNINNVFGKLNKLSIMNNWFLLVHDFSGSSVNMLATYLDEYIKDHLDHIIYGLDLRIDEGCYIDLCECKLEPMSTDELKVYNPYFGHNDKYIKELTDVCKAQNQIVGKHIARQLVSVVRLYDKIKFKRMNCREIRLFENEFRFSGALGHVNFNELMGKGDFKEIEKKMLSVIEKFLNKLPTGFTNNNVWLVLLNIKTSRHGTALSQIFEYLKGSKIENHILSEGGQYLYTSQ